MDEYTLYLDESKNNKGTRFAICGFIVKNTNINILEEGILEAKQCIWDNEYIQNHTPILHCVELTTIKNYSDNNTRLTRYIQKHPHYSILQNKDSASIVTIYNNIYAKLNKLLKDLNCIVIGCTIDIQKVKYIYGEQFRIDPELFFEVAMQETIENYSYFLYMNNAIGSIIYESRNNDDAQTNRAPDFKMYDNFCKIKSCNKGISFINQNMLSKTIRYLNIFNKQENVLGLQLADFIAYNILQNIDRPVSQYNEFMKKIMSRTYNGNFNLEDNDLRTYFGLKHLPLDFETIHSQEIEILKLRRSNNGLKRERNSLVKKNDFLTKDKETLLEENKRYKEEIQCLQEKIKNLNQTT